MITYVYHHSWTDEVKAFKFQDDFLTSLLQQEA